jgi:anti-anti-sigma factor
MVSAHAGAGSARELTLRSEVRGTSIDVALSGELDMAVAFKLEPELDRLLATPGIRTLVLDLADVSFVDSAGLGALLSIREEATRLGIDLTIARMSALVRRLLDVTATGGVLGSDPLPEDLVGKAPAVLIVDDDAGFRQVARILLQRCGLRVAGEASDGAQARSGCERLRPDAVLLDVNLPDGYGPALACELRSAWPGLPVLLTSTDPWVEGATDIAFVPKTELPSADLAGLLARP